MTAFLADGAGTSVDQGVSTFLFVAALLFGWVFVRRIRGKGFLGLPTAVAWMAGAASAASIVLAFVLPPIISPDVTVRPRSPARVVILSPRPGAVYRGSPARVPVQVRVIGGTVVRTTSTNVVPDQGHVHLYLDGHIIFMSYTLREVLPVPPGHHQLQAEFVAVDHQPFNPRVLTSVSFSVTGSSRG